MLRFAVLPTLAAGFGYYLMSGGVEFVVSSFVPYFDYTGDLEVSGVVNGATIGTMHTINYDLSGVDPNCTSGAGDAANSCGVHFHEGTSCDEGAGAHYYSPDLDVDPWLVVSYTATMMDGLYVSTLTDSSLTVETGLNSSAIVGHTFVVHGFDGGRVACGIIE